MERDRLSGISRYAVLDTSTLEFFGFCGYKDVTDDAGERWMDFGWRYTKSVWRRGFGMEAASAVYDYGKRDLGLTKIEARAHQDNTASLRIIEKLGLCYLEDYESPVGVFRRYVES